MSTPDNCFDDGNYFDIPQPVSAVTYALALPNEPSQQSTYLYKQTFWQRESATNPRIRLPYSLTPVDSGMTPAPVASTGAGYLLNGAKTTGATVLNLKTGSGTINAGDLIYHAAYPADKYLVVSALDPATGNVTIAAPGLVRNTSDNAIITLAPRQILLISDGDDGTRQIGAGIIEWDRHWVSMPTTFTKRYPYLYNAQRAEQITVPWLGDWRGAGDGSGEQIFTGSYKTFIQVSEKVEPCFATETNEFFVTQAAANAAFKRPFSAYKSIELDTTNPGNVVQKLIITGTPPPVLLPTVAQTVPIVAAPSDVSQWMGDIWCVKTIRVISQYAAYRTIAAKTHLIDDFVTGPGQPY